MRHAWGCCFGLSPRVRGIPARAGEPPPYQCWGGQLAVYPRACGGAAHNAPRNPGLQGLSPRVRGSPAGAFLHQPGRGSIPARAGEPIPWSFPESERRVYPRACGGARTKPLLPPILQGLSPRVRGSRFSADTPVASRRSIPARAGEPRRWAGAGILCRVYPRACGGASGSAALPLMTIGLSPRVRGSP